MFVCNRTGGFHAPVYDVDRAALFCMDCELPIVSWVGEAVWLSQTAVYEEPY